MGPKLDPAQGEAAVAAEPNERPIEPPKPFDGWPEKIPHLHIVQDAEGNAVETTLTYITQEEWVQQKMALKEDLARDIAEGKKSREELLAEYVHLAGRIKLTSIVGIPDLE